MEWTMVQQHMASVGFPLKPYQEEGVRWMSHQEEQDPQGGYILADDPGLGKTIQVATLLLLRPGYTLIVVPSSILVQWVETLHRIQPAWRIYSHVGPRRIRQRLDLMKKEYDICITTLPTLLADLGGSTGGHHITLMHSIFPSKPWTRVILDEAHLIRNPRTQSFQLMGSLPAYHRVALTGTPIQNKKADLVSLFWYTRVVAMGLHVSDSVFRDLTERFVLRRTKEILYADSSLGFHRYACENVMIPFRDPCEQEQYLAIQQLLQTVFRKESREAENRRDLMMMILEMILRLRQASCHVEIPWSAIESKYGIRSPFPIRAGFVPSKFQTTGDLLRSFPQEDRVIIFCQFLTEIQRLREWLEESDADAMGTVGVYTGELTMEQKSIVLQSCPRIILVQTRCGGVGLNLQEYNRVIIMSPDFNPGNEIQAIARAHRLGQRKQVYVYRLIVVIAPIATPEEDSTAVAVAPPSTIDERMLDIQIRKKLVISDVMRDSSHMDNADTRYMEFSPTKDFRRARLTLKDLQQMAGASQSL